MEVSSFFLPPSVITNNNIIPLIPPRGAGVHSRPGSTALLPLLITHTRGPQKNKRFGSHIAPQNSMCCPAAPSPYIPDPPSSSSAILGGSSITPGSFPLGEAIVTLQSPRLSQRGPIPDPRGGSALSAPTSFAAGKWQSPRKLGTPGAPVPSAAQGQCRGCPPCTLLVLQGDTRETSRTPQPSPSALFWGCWCGKHPLCPS